MTRFLGIENRGALVVMLDIGIAMHGSARRRTDGHSMSTICGFASRTCRIMGAMFLLNLLLLLN